MTANQFRLFIAILSTIFVLGILAIGYVMAENGRYQPFDYRTQQLTEGAYKNVNGNPTAFDTRTGKIVPQ